MYKMEGSSSFRIAHTSIFDTMRAYNPDYTDEEVEEAVRAFNRRTAPEINPLRGVAERENTRSAIDFQRLQERAAASERMRMLPFMSGLIGMRGGVKIHPSDSTSRQRGAHDGLPDLPAFKSNKNIFSRY